MNKNLLKYMFVGSLAMSPVLADKHDDILSKDLIKGEKLIVDAKGDIHKLVGFNSDGSYAYLINVERVATKDLKRMIGEKAPSDMKE